MPNPPKILAFAGSARTESFNKTALRIAAEAARAAGGEITLIDLRDFPLPLYDGDLEEREGLPANAARLRELFLNHRGLLLSCPEYNSSITPLLKNTIDWVSRNEKKTGSLECFQGKVAALMAASPGALGGLRGLVHMRAILGNIGVLVIPEQIEIVKAHEAFNQDGTLKDARQQKSVQTVGSALTKILLSLNA